MNCNEKQNSVRLFLKQLKKRYDIIITSADKGWTRVTQDVKLNIKEAERQLNNIEKYRPLLNDSTKIKNGTVNKTIERFQKEHLIKDGVAEGLITQNPRAPCFYAKSTIHKEGIFGRPVISSVNCHSLKHRKMLITTYNQ